MDFETYSRESARTASGQFHEEIVNPFLLGTVLDNAIRTGSCLDQCKKGLFYGKPLNSDELKNSSSMALPDTSLVDRNLLHAAMGVLTEAVELLDAIQSAMKGSSLDRVNLIEEMGDIEWYMAMAYRSIGTTPELVREINIAKLKARFPLKFTETEANQRDLQKERTVLEEGGQKK